MTPLTQPLYLRRASLRTLAKGLEELIRHIGRDLVADTAPVFRRFCIQKPLYIGPADTSLLERGKQCPHSGTPV